MITYPYLLTSDQHCHPWSQFSKVDPDGVNSRLRIILNEMQRAYETLASKHKPHAKLNAFMAGDLFHTRGTITPSVFNPTHSAIEAIHSRFNVETVAIPGNHDLEGKDSNELGNAMQSLAAIPNFEVSTDHMICGDVVVIPWFQDLNDLRKKIQKMAKMQAAINKLERTDLIIHAPVNGVIKGIPDHGLEAEELAEFGFRRVFAGHYHDHKVYCDGKVISVGATTHQTWNDPGTRAGFLLVYEDRVEHYPTEAPLFIDINQLIELDPKVDPLTVVKGNYARWKLDDLTDKEAAKIKKELTDAGALGVLLNVTKKTAVSRSGAVARTVHKLDTSVGEYIKNDLKPVYEEDVSKLAQEVLDEARS